MEAQVEVVFGRQFLVVNEPLRKTLVVIIDQGTQYPEAEIGATRRRRNVLVAGSHEARGEEIPTLRRDEVVVPEELQQRVRALPLFRRLSLLQLLDFLINALP